MHQSAGLRKQSRVCVPVMWFSANAQCQAVDRNACMSLKSCAYCRYVKAHEAFLKKEEQLMGHMSGYKTGEELYSGGRWMPPAPRVGGWGQA